MLTPEIRSIASYFGSPYTCERYYTMGSMEYNRLRHEGKIPPETRGSIWLPKVDTVNYKLIDEIGWAFLIRNLKLQLKPLTQITKDDLIECRTAMGFEDSTWAKKCAVDSRKETIRLDDVIMEFDTGMIYSYFSDKPLPAAGAYAYLQSKHYYIPGLIGVNYVNLVNDPFSIFLQ